MGEAGPREAFMDAEVWFEVIRPALADKQGWALFISTPDGTASWFYDLWCYVPQDETGDWKRWSFTLKSKTLCYQIPRPEQRVFLVTNTRSRLEPRQIGPLERATPKFDQNSENCFQTNPLCCRNPDPLLRRHLYFPNTGNDDRSEYMQARNLLLS